MNFKNVLGKLVAQLKSDKKSSISLGVFLVIIFLGLAYPKIMAVIGACAIMVWVDKRSDGHKSLSFLKVPLEMFKSVKDDIAKAPAKMDEAVKAESEKAESEKKPSEDKAE